MFLKFLMLLARTLELVQSFSNSSVGFGGSCFQRIFSTWSTYASAMAYPVTNYWRQVIKINDYQKMRFVNRVVSSMFNTVSGKIAILGFAFQEGYSQCGVYDPQVTEGSDSEDLSMNKFDWDHPVHLQPLSPTSVKQVSVVWDAYEAAKDAHGLCILTEWDEFKTLDYQRIYNNMQKPAFVFDGRNVVNVEKLREIGFIVYSIGKPLDPWLKDMPAVA
ncbi:UDP-glucose/GDP-mannose dehydrogenase, C-terminal [Dillenia turbinata]|uniref:UDP-glucose/GDP-mannose dehydrogenase, C-terminal n=1 Tax=Dillenia turbinata TaxID=194707 RepID=A0AAN8UUM4_9MAGN